MIIATGLNLTQASEQDVFDFIALVLIQQGRPSTDGKRCRYRLTDERGECRCGIGHLINDAEYSPDHEGATIDTILNYISEQRPPLPSIEAWVAAGVALGNSQRRVEFLAAIQSAHDSLTLQDANLRGQLLHVAQRFALDASILSYREATTTRAPEQWPNQYAGAPRPRAQYSIIGPDDEV